MDNLKNILKDRGLSIRKFAKLVGVSPASCCRYVKGEQRPKFETMLKMAKVLEVGVYELYGDSVTNLKQLRKCPYCDTGSDGYRYPKFNIDFGVFGEGQLSIYISNSLEKLGIDLTVNDSLDLFSEAVKIKYCPYCGNRIGDITQTTRGYKIEGT
jgi:transcriptional regulator with XRE-family HTH domain